MQYLRTNTATRITVGPFMGLDGVTPKTALTVTSCKLTSVVDTGGVPTLVLDTNPTASGGSNDMVHITGDDAGFYDLELAAADVNYLGRMRLALTDATNHLPVFHEFTILPAMIYDSFVLGTDRFDTNVTHVADTAQTAGDIYGVLTGAQSEPGQGAPAVNASPLTKIAYLFKAWRNKKTQTSSTYSLFADDASTVDQKASVSDDGTTTTVGEVASGP